VICVSPYNRPSSTGNRQFPGSNAWPEFARWSDLTLVSLLVTFSTFLYLNTLLNGFVYDDDTQVLNNPYLHSLRHIPQIFTTTVWSFIGVEGVTNYYRPMMTLGYLACYRFFGPLAYGFHLANIALHAAVVGLLFAVTRRIFQSRRVAFVAAGLFALHPIHTESVAWIAGVTDLELSLFYLLTFWLFLGLGRVGSGRSGLARLAMVVSFVLGLLSKEQTLTLPLLAMVYEHAYREDRRETAWTQKLSRYGVLWLLVVGYLLFRVRFFGALAPVVQIPTMTWYQAILSAIVLNGQYWVKLLWPVHLCAFHVYHKSVSVLDPRVMAGAAGLVLVAALFLVLWRRGSGSRARLASFGLVWILVTLAPVLNARWMPANVFAERYLYLPSAGFCWIVGWGFAELWETAGHYRGVWRKTFAAVSVLVSVLCVLRVVIRNRDWHDDVTLYLRTLAVEPGAYHIRNNLGVVYWHRGDAEDAEREWTRALRNAPNRAFILNNLGLVYTKKKQYAKALEFLRSAMRLKPTYTDSHLNLGIAYEEMGLLDQAGEQFEAAVALSSLDFDAHNRLGELYLKQERFPEATEQFAESVRSQPNVKGYDDLGEVCLRGGQRERAESAFRQAATLNAFDSRAHFGLGAIEATSGRNADAIRDYEAGLESDPNNPDAQRALARLKETNTGGPTAKR